MFNSFWVSAFPEIFGNAIVIDSVAYIPLDTAIGAVATTVVIYGTLFGFSCWFADLFADLLLSFFKHFWKRNNPPAAEG